MRTANTLLITVALTAAAVSTAVASSSETRCSKVQAATPVTSAKIQADLEGLGYRILKTELDHRCYVFIAVNDSGYPIEVTYEPASGELVNAKLR